LVLLGVYQGKQATALPCFSLPTLFIGVLLTWSHFSQGHCSKDNY